MRYVWSYEKISAKRWALILADLRDPMRAVRAPGYESTRLIDVLKATWYLNGGFVGDLPEHTVRLLDQIKADSPDA